MGKTSFSHTESRAILMGANNRVILRTLERSIARLPKRRRSPRDIYREADVVFLALGSARL